MPESPAPGPAVLRIRLGARLRSLRESRGISAQQAARTIRGSDSKISRIELGRHAAREIDVADLLTMYEVTGSEREELLRLASLALEPAWWQRYGDVLPAWFHAYLGYEEAAEAILSYDTHTLPGLLQTSDYTAGLLAAADFGASEMASLLELRAGRIARFAASGWRLTAVIDEAVLHRPVTDAGVLAAQLRHLRDASDWPGLRIRIRRLAAGAPPTPSGFSILRMPGGEPPDVVYTEQLTGASYLDRPAEVARYSAAMDLLISTSQPAEQAGAIVDTVLAQLN